MGHYRPSAMRQQKAQTVPQEPNLIPIMNLFLTIIPMLMMMVVISQIALLALNFSQGEGGVSYGQGGGVVEVLKPKKWKSISWATNMPRKIILQ